MALDNGRVHSAVRITSAGDLLGTGSLLTVRSEMFPQRRYRYVITAHHVIRNQVEVAVEVPNPFGNGELYEPVLVRNWTQPLPEVDLAVAPFHPPGVLRCWSNEIESAFIPGPEITESSLGATVYYVGIFEPLMRPMARSGTLGALDQAGIPHKGGYTYAAHLVDCRSYEGFSGSPCFELIEYADLQPLRLPDLGLGMPAEIAEQVPQTGGQLMYYAMFCGMFTAHYADIEPADGVISRYGIGVMLRSADIREALMTDEMREGRRRADETEAARRRAKEDSGPRFENVGRSTGDEEFERFEDLTRHLVQTPKPKSNDG